jgi:hypothetical protein
MPQKAGQSEGGAYEVSTSTTPDATALFRRDKQEGGRQREKLDPCVSSISMLHGVHGERRDRDDLGKHSGTSTQKVREG